MEMIMKTLAMALVALSVLAGTVVASVDAQALTINQLDHDNRGGHNGG